MDFVQQGALIAMALVLVEQPEARVKPLRAHIDRLYGNKGAEVSWRCRGAPQQHEQGTAFWAAPPAAPVAILSCPTVPSSPLTPGAFLINPLCSPLLQVMTRMGAVMAAGILDCGGRNATIGLRSRSGHFRWVGKKVGDTSRWGGTSRGHFWWV